MYPPFLKSIARGKTREDVGEIERGRDKVGDDVDAERGDGEGQRGERGEEPAVELGRDLLRVQHDLAIDLERRDRRHAGDEREQQQVHRQAPEVALRHRRLVLGVAREVAEVQVERGEVGDPGRADRHQRPERARLAGDAGVLGLVEQHRLGKGVVEREAARLHAQADRQNQHRHPHGRAGPVLELAHGLHAVMNDEQLQRPDDDVANHLEPRVAEKMGALVELHQGVGAGQERDDRARCRRRLRAVPEAGDDGADERRQVGAPDAERGPRQDWVRHAGLLARVADQAHQEEDDERADADRDDEVEEAAAEQKQARGQVEPQRLCTSEVQTLKMLKAPQWRSFADARSSL